MQDWLGDTAYRSEKRIFLSAAIGSGAWIEMKTQLGLGCLFYAVTPLTRTDFGRAHESMRLRISHARVTSAFWLANLRARSRLPMMDLYRLIVVSTNERLPYPVLACHDMRPLSAMVATWPSRCVGGPSISFGIKCGRGGMMILTPALCH